MTPDAAKEYTESLAQIFAGSWRQIAWATEQGIPEALDLTTEQWVKEHLGNYVRMAIPDRREAVAELTDGGMSQRRIGEVLGVDEKTVRRDIAAASAAEDDPEVSDTETEQKDSAASAASVGDVETETEKAERIARVNRFATIEIAYQANNVASLIKSEEQINRLMEIICDHADEYEEYAKHKISHLIKSFGVLAKCSVPLLKALEDKDQ